MPWHTILVRVYRKVLLKTEWYTNDVGYFLRSRDARQTHNIKGKTCCYPERSTPQRVLNWGQRVIVILSVLGVLVFVVGRVVRSRHRSTLRRDIFD